MKRITGAVAASVLLLTTVSCGSAGESKSGSNSSLKKITIGWVAPDSTGVFKTATDYFMKSAKDAKSAGFDVKIISQSPPGGQTDSSGMVQIIENMVSQKVDVLMVSPADTEAIKPAIRAANSAKIPVVYINLLTDQKDINVASYIGYDNKQAAAVAAYSILDYYGGPGVLGAGKKVDVKKGEYLDLAFWEKLYANVDPNSIKVKGVVIEGLKGSFYSNERVDGFTSVMKKFPSSKILGIQPGDWTRQAGSSQTEDFLAKYPKGQLDYIWAASNEMGLGAINIASRAGRIDSAGSTGPTVGQVGIFTNDNTAESTDQIRKGSLISEVTHGFPDWGWIGTKVAVKLACGETVDKKIDIRPRVVYQGNADQFYPNPSLPKIDWQSIKATCTP